MTEQKNSIVGRFSFDFQVPGLAEKRPSVIVGDVVHLHELNRSGEPTGTRVEGSVHEVHLEKVLLGISERFQDILRFLTP